MTRRNIFCGAGILIGKIGRNGKNDHVSVVAAKKKARW